MSGRNLSDEDESHRRNGRMAYCTSASLPSWILEKEDGLAGQPSSTRRGDVAISVIAFADAGKR